MSTYDFFISSGWGFALTIFALISVIINIIQFFTGRKTRKIFISFTIEPFSKAINEIIEKNHLELDFPHFSKFTIILKNIGNTDLSKENFEAPLEFIFGKNIEYINTETSDDLITRDSLYFADDRIKLNPFLFQKAEKIIITGFFTSREDITDQKTRIRIKDFTIISDKDYSEQPVIFKIMPLIAFGLAIIGFFLLLFYSNSQVIGTFTILLGVLINAISSIIERVSTSKNI